MDLPIAILVVLGAAVIGFAAAGLVRRTGPVLSNPTRGTSMPIVAGTSFAVILAFLILAAFQTYSGAKSGAASEANAVLEMTRTAELFPASERQRLRSDLVCYGRAVVREEWPAMRQGHSSPLVDDWIATYRSAFRHVTVRSLREQTAFQDLVTAAGTLDAGRQQRLSDDTPAIPTPLWLALIFVGGVAVSLQLGMAGPDERLRVQGLQIAAIAAVVTTGLLMVNFLDHPYGTQVGSLEPTAMRHTLTLIQDLEPSLRPGCTWSGQQI